MQNIYKVTRIFKKVKGNNPKIVSNAMGKHKNLTG
jgi:hypothetical protein